jgi:methionyl-tRNA formyltransferase
MIKVIILTSSRQGFASFQLAELVKSKKIIVQAVVLNEGLIMNKKKHYKRKIAKIFKIGLFGALNGIRMRKWYSTGVYKYLDIPTIESLCKEHNITLSITPTINSSQTIEYFKNANADIGLSLGNGYIGKKVFSIPKFGMINVHHEELPAYQNAQSIIWQLYNDSDNTGYTIHKIDKHIDTGEILFKEVIPIIFKQNLESTVSLNYSILWKKSSEGLVLLLENFENYFKKSFPQGQGKSYTTPSLKQYLKILRNFKKKYMLSTSSIGNGGG